MNAKALIGTVLIGSIFFTGSAEAYDLPKIFAEKETSATKPIAKVDWSSFENFAQKIKIALAENENLPASSPARQAEDKNLIFVAFYKGNAYFLDKFSVTVKKNTAEKKSWRQRIYPIGAGISPQNAKATAQKFNVDSSGIFNSTGHGNDLSKVTDEADRKFLQECFKVGYYCAFGVDFDKL